MTKIEKWKQDTRKTLEEMNSTGFIEMPGDKFLVMFDREFTETENEKANSINLEFVMKVYAYTYNVKARYTGFAFSLDANVITSYSNVVIYDEKVNEGILSGIEDLQFKFKTQIDIYEIAYTSYNN